MIILSFHVPAAKPNGGSTDGSTGQNGSRRHYTGTKETKKGNVLFL